jgi:hypothetical protein
MGRSSSEYDAKHPSRFKCSWICERLPVGKQSASKTLTSRSTGTNPYGSAYGPFSCSCGTQDAGNQTSSYAQQHLSTGCDSTQTPSCSFKLGQQSHGLRKSLLTQTSHSTRAMQLTSGSMPPKRIHRPRCYGQLRQPGRHRKRPFLGRR